MAESGIIVIKKYTYLLVTLGSCKTTYACEKNHKSSEIPAGYS